VVVVVVADTSLQLPAVFPKRWRVITITNGVMMMVVVVVVVIVVVASCSHEP